MQKNNYPCVLTIAGTDPSGGAGIQADIKVISAIGCYAASIVTALVAQNTQGVISTHDIPKNFLQQQFTAVLNDLTISAVKIGMLHNISVIEVISDILKNNILPPVVLDPVMISKSRHELLDMSAISYLKDKIFPHVDVITPNKHEAEKILDRNIQTANEMEQAAEELAQTYQVSVLIKGGHFAGKNSSDVLFSLEEKALSWFHAERINTHNTHGTGCSLSSAIASFLAHGYGLPQAVLKAKKYISTAIHAAKNLNIGKGYGPINHFYFIKSDTHDIFKHD